MSEGIRFVLRRATLLSEDEPLETVSAATRTAAQQLVEELDGLPLALDQAGAYIEETGCSLSEYLALYGQHRLALLKRKSSMVSDYPHTVASTWTLSFSQVEQADPAAADLLRVCAFLHPDAIPEEILTEGAAALGPHLQEVATEPLLLNEAIQLLRRYSLVKRDAEAKLLNLHRLVQVVLKESLDTRIQRQWAERVLLAVNAAFPPVEHSAWPQCERLLAQALTAAQLIEQYQIISEEAGRLLHETATYLRDRARYRRSGATLPASHYVSESSSWGRSILMWPFRSTAWPASIRTRVNMRRQSRSISEPYASGSSSLGPEHPDVAHSLYGLALLYHEQGKYAEAEPLYQRALRIREQQLGPEHPDVAYPLNDLAILYSEQGKYAEAEPLYQRALRIWEQQLGPEHPMWPMRSTTWRNSITSRASMRRRSRSTSAPCTSGNSTWDRSIPMWPSPLNNLANLYAEQGKYAEAEPLYQRALHIWEQQLGPEHPMWPIRSTAWRTSTLSRASMSKRSRSTNAPCAFANSS